MTNKKDIEFESDKVKAYVQQIQAENALLRQANEEVNELLIKLGCPTKATAKRKVLCLQQQLDQLEAEVKSKTEYIQEQRDIINQYSKEIEMYKKCQGKRASKREEELKAENDELKVQNIKYMNGNISYQLKNSLYKQTLTEIKEIAEHCINQDICTTCDNNEKCHIEDEEIPTYDVCKLILQKISECEGNDEKH